MSGAALQYLLPSVRVIDVSLTCVYGACSDGCSGTLGLDNDGFLLQWTQRRALCLRLIRALRHGSFRK